MVASAPKFRPKLPAYGRELLQARQAGRHPARVWVIFSQDWGRRPADVPVLCVKPLEWVAGLLDWGLVAGVRVDVVNRDEAESVYPFAAEIARVAAPVYVHSRWPEDADPFEAWPDAPGDAICEDISHAAFCRRAWDQAAGTMRWPPWWSEDLERDYRARDAKRFEWEVYQLERRRQQESAA